MDYRYAKAFLLVAETKSFTRAAEELKVAQSAISRQITLFEESLRKQLLIRSSRKVFLTPHGELLYQRLKGFDQWVESEFLHRSPTIRVGAMQGILESWLMERILSIPQNKIPNLKVHSMKDEQVFRAIHQGDIDIGFSTTKIESDSVSSRLLFKEEFVLISKSKMSFSEAKNQRWISGTQGKYLNQIFPKKPENFIQVESTGAILRLVERGLGVAVLPKHLIPSDFKGELTHLPKISGGMYLSLPNYKLFPAEMRQFIDFIVK